MNIYQHAQSRIKEFGSFGQILHTQDAYALGYAEAAYYHQEFAKQVKLLLERQQKVKNEMFGHCCSNGVFNVWGKPFDCTELNEVNRAVESMLKSIENNPIYEPLERTKP